MCACLRRDPGSPPHLKKVRTDYHLSAAILPIRNCIPREQAFISMNKGAVASLVRASLSTSRPRITVHKRPALTHRDRHDSCCRRDGEASRWCLSDAWASLKRLGGTGGLSRNALEAGFITALQPNDDGSVIGMTWKSSNNLRMF